MSLALRALLSDRALLSCVTFNSHDRVLHVPKSLKISQATELCNRRKQRFVFVLDVVDESFTPSSASLPPGPIVGFLDPFEFLLNRAGKVHGRKKPATVSTEGGLRKQGTASKVAFRVESTESVEMLQANV